MLGGAGGVHPTVATAKREKASAARPADNEAFVMRKSPPG
jgi:hypothetical protein